MILMHKTMFTIFTTAMFTILLLLLGYLAYTLWKQEEKFLCFTIILAILVVIAAVVSIWFSSGVIA